MSKINNKEVEKALRLTGGLVSHAAKMLGVSHTAVNSRIKKSEHLKTVLEEVRCSFIDLAEGKMMKIVNNEQHDKHFSACCFVLKCLGQQRGYVEHQKIEHSVNTEDQSGCILIAPFVPKEKDK